MKFHRFGGSIALAAVTALAAHSARAQPANSSPSPSHGGPVTARLVWAREAESCMSREALEAAVNDRWGREVLRDREPTDLVLVGKVGPAGDGKWSAKLEMRRGDGSSLGSREITTHADECASLNDSISLAAGLMLDMSRQRVEEERASLAASPKRAETLPVAANPAPRRVPWHWEAQLGGEAVAGLFPAVAVGARPAVAVEPADFWRLEIGATFWAHQEHLDGDRGARFAAWTLDFGICPLSRRLSEPLVVRGCISQRLGVIRAEGVGLSHAETTDDTFYAIGLRSSVSWAFTTRFGLELGVRADVPVSRYRFVYEDAAQRPREIHRVSLVTAGLDLGLVFRF